MTPENTRIAKNGRTVCRKCALINRNRWRAKKRAVTGYTNRPPWMPYEDWFWSWVERGSEDDCWPWTRALDANGYGHIRREKGATVGAHIIAWEIENGKQVPDDLFVLHSCDFPACCNPRHLRIGTAADNARDRNERGRDARGEGHGMSVLTAETVEGIKALRGQGLLYREIAERLNIKPATVSDVCSGRTWKHV